MKEIISYNVLADLMEPPS